MRYLSNSMCNVALMGMLKDLLLNPIVVVSEFTMNAPGCTVFPEGVALLNQFEYPEVRLAG